VCRRIALIRSGRLVAVHALDNLRRARPRRITIHFAAPVTTAGLPPDVRVLSQSSTEWLVEVRGPLGPLVAALAPLPIADLSETTVSLEDIVLDLFAGAAAC
jgi:ABC-2 type transport system ATP-binding protein